MRNFVALLRGINSGANPMLRMEELRTVFSDLGFKNVSTVIASGNVLFDLPENKAQQTRTTLESQIEQTIETSLGFKSSAIVRTLPELQSIIALEPFAQIKTSVNAKPHVTFLKDMQQPVSLNLALKGKDFKIIRYLPGAILFVIDLNQTGSPNMMTLLEKHYGKQITTRTWSTVQKIHQKMLVA